MKKVLRAAVLALAAFPIAALASITFTSGSIYSTSDSAINQYTSTGALIGSLSMPGSDLRGLSFGSDGLLYVVHSGDPFSPSASVQAIDASGAVVRSYAFTGSIAGNISFGKITFDATGNHFFVGAGDGVYKFDVAGTSGSLYKNVEGFDVEALPNGDLLVASAYSLNRFDSTGQFLGAVSALSDPKGITNDSYPRLADIRGVEYDPGTDTTFVTMLGYSSLVNMSFKVLALAGSSNVITGMEKFTYGDDMFLTQDGRLLVGSRTQAPGIFSVDLGFEGQAGGGAARFVTMMPAPTPVPEPSSAVLLALGLGGLAFAAKRRPS